MDYEEEEKNNFDGVAEDEFEDEPLDLPDEPLESSDYEEDDPEDQYH